MPSQRRRKDYRKQGITTKKGQFGAGLGSSKLAPKTPGSRLTELQNAAFYFIQYKMYIQGIVMDKENKSPLKSFLNLIEKYGTDFSSKLHRTSKYRGNKTDVFSHDNLQ